MRWALHIALMVAGALAVSIVAPAKADVSATDVKSQFLPRFARYVTWPSAAMPEASSPFSLCVIGGDPFGETLDSAARGQSVDGRRIVVRRLRTATAAGGCQIAFIGRNGDEPVGQTLASLRNKPILTVTDSNQGGARGIIHFSVVGGRVRFMIDEAGAASRGLSISSRLLALAVAVKQR